MPAEQRAEVIRVTQEHGPKLTCRLSPEEIGALAEKLVNAETAEEAEAIKKEMLNGFYGAIIDA